MIHLFEWLQDATVRQIAQAMDKGELSAYELTLFYLDRIARFNTQGPMINAILELNPDALAIAQGMDRERQQHGARSMLHGISVLLKDNIQTGDNMHTSAGSLCLRAWYAPNDAYLVKRLKNAGAVILGKANMTEWANFMTDDMPNGYSSRGGQVRNPYGPGHFDTGGSSSGSGAAVAALFVQLAVGTETSGSILSPASSNSVVGLKPTLGLISRSGIIPLAHSQDTAGPMARTVEDVAVMLSVIAGSDAADPATNAVDEFVVDYTSSLKKDGLQGVRLGIARPGYYDELTKEQLLVMEQAIQDLEKAGAVIVDPIMVPMTDDIADYAVLTYEFKADLNAFLARLGATSPVHSLSDVIMYNESHADTALVYGQSILLASEQTSGTLTEPEYLQARAKDLMASREEGIDAVLARYDIDAIVFPANFGAAIGAKAGYPSICVPAGYTKDGEPLGITFTAGAFSEADLLRYAYAFEEATKRRVSPKF